MFNTKLKSNRKRRIFSFAKPVVLILVISLSVLGISADGSQTLRSNFAGKFLIGAAVTGGEWGRTSTMTTAGDAIMSEFSSVTAENCMKAQLIQPNPGQFQWGPADFIVNNATRLGLGVRGHTLVWHRTVPQWMTRGSKDQVRRNLQNHINALAGRYRGRIYAWDVVNEAIADGSGTYRKDSSWYKAYGDETYIVDAFDFARAAAPDAQLIYNDYSLVNSGKRRKAVKMIKDLKLKEHGLTGVGIQAHWSMTWPSTSELQRTIDTFAKMGLDVQITELDIDCYSNGTDKEKAYDSKLEKKLAKRYKDIFKVFKKNSDKISSVTFWGIADDHTWLHTFNGNSGTISYRENYPLLFTKEYQKKQAYYDIMK